MKKIPLSKNIYALVDDSDFDFLSTKKWYALNGGKRSNTFYAATSVKQADGTFKRGILMHRVLLEPSVGKEIDHINRNGLDNQRKNLRIVTHKENLKNKSKYRSNKSGSVGVSWHKATKKWIAQITFNGQRKHLGVFNDREKAESKFLSSRLLLNGF